MIFIAVGIVSSVLDLLEIFVTFHFRIKQAVFLNIFFIFDLLMIRKLRHGFLMLLFQLRNSGIVLFLRLHFLLCAAYFHRLIIFGIKMCLDVSLRIGNQLGNLIFVLCLHCFCLFQFFPGIGKPVFFLTFGEALVSPDSIHLILDRNDFIGTVGSQTVNLFLNFSDIFIDRLTQL